MFEVLGVAFLDGLGRVVELVIPPWRIFDFLVDFGLVDAVGPVMFVFTGVTVTIFFLVVTTGSDVTVLTGGFLGTLSGTVLGSMGGVLFVILLRLRVRLNFLAILEDDEGVVGLVSGTIKSSSSSSS